jgi:uncharacterized protein (DUF433 family)
MKTLKDFDRITFDPEVMGGKACIRGMRVTVACIVRQLAAGMTIDKLLSDYPYLEREDIPQCLQYAAWLTEGRDLEIPETADSELVAA